MNEVLFLENITVDRGPKRRILNLEALDPLEAELGAAERGSSLHAALDEFLKTYPSGLLPSDALRLFEQMGEALAALVERARTEQPPLSSDHWLNTQVPY